MTNAQALWAGARALGGSATASRGRRSCQGRQQRSQRGNIACRRGEQHALDQRARFPEQVRGQAEAGRPGGRRPRRSEEHTSELQSRRDLVCRLLLEKKKKKKKYTQNAKKKKNNQQR